MTVLGRDPEMALLRDALAAATAGRGRFVLLSGQPGIGKTTMTAALAADAAAAGVCVVAALAPETSGAPPYCPTRSSATSG